MKKLQLLLLILVIIASNSYARKQYILNSKYISKADTVWVFTPSTYSANVTKAYPLIYLLHGWSGNYHQWNDIMNCQKYADKYGFIIVCPDGQYDSWYINSPAIKASQYTDFFFMDLLPFVSKTYRVDKDNVFITGLSMGGHGALYLFEQKPELFRSAGSLSGVLDLTNFWNNYRIMDYLGIKDQLSSADVLKSFSVTGNISKIADCGKEIIFTCGTSDPFYEANNEFMRLCNMNHIKATYISSPGGHDYPYWKSAIAYHFDFFSKILKTEK